MKNYWIRGLETMAKKYIGIDFRLLSLIFLVSDIVGIFLIPIVWIKWSLGIVLLMALFVFFSLAMHDVWKEDMDAVKPLVGLKALQTKELISNPRTYLEVKVSRIIGFSNSFDVNFLVINGTLFNLKLGWETKATTCISLGGTDGSSYHFQKPSIEGRVESLDAGRYVEDLKLNQLLPDDFVSNRKMITDRQSRAITKLRFNVFMEILNDDIKRKVQFQPEWEGEI